jgi:ketosteroid isomerase-like protein
VYAWIVRLMIRRNVRRANAGDVDALLRAYARDAVLVYPGRHSWAGEYRGRPEVERFLRRFVSVGIRGEAHEILVNGPPWNTRVAVFVHDWIPGADGRDVYSNRAVLRVHTRWGRITAQEDYEDSDVYANRAVLFGRIAWGKIVYQEDYVDTQKVADFDQYLALNEPRAQ